MVPSAAQFKKLLQEIYQGIPDEDPTKRERQILISCVVASAEAVDKIEKVLKEVVGPALAALMPATATATETATATTPETEDAPPIRATITASAPAAPPPQAASISKTTTPVNGNTATTAPQPVARS